MTNSGMSSRGEDAAASYLERTDICVVERHWKCDVGQIDIVGWDGNVLVLVDVKTRSTSEGTGSEAPTPARQCKIRRLAEAYLKYSDVQPDRIRYDLIDILVIAQDRALLRHHRAAFVVE